MLFKDPNPFIIDSQKIGRLFCFIFWLWFFCAFLLLSSLRELRYLLQGFWWRSGRHGITDPSNYGKDSDHQDQDRQQDRPEPEIVTQWVRIVKPLRYRSEEPPEIDHYEQKSDGENYSAYSLIL